MIVGAVKSVVTLAFLMTLSAGTEAAQASERCEQVFINKNSDLGQSRAFPQDAFTLARVEKEIKNSQQASRFFMAEIKKESDSLKAASRGKVVELDWLCLGAGPQCAAASLVLGRTSAKSLVLERSDLVAKTFAEKDFFINSVEMELLSMHDFPGGVGSLAHHTSQKYAHSSQLASHIQQQQYVSGVPVLLGTTLTGARVYQKGNEWLVEITTDQNITLRTKNFLIGTGLGDVGTKVRDPGYKSAFQADFQKHLAQPGQLFPIMSTDTFLTVLKNAQLKGKKVTLPSRVIVIGDGDGSRISIEGLRDPHVQIPADFHLTWVGNEFSTPQQYVASRGGGDRYIHKIVPFYEAGQIHGIPGHVQAWSKGGTTGSMRLTTLVKETQSQFEAEGTLIIDSTGYDPVVPHILQMMGAQSTLADVTGPLPELKLTSTVLARRAVSVEGQPLPVLALGAAAGPLATNLELAHSPNNNPMAIFNTVPRTSMALSILTGVPAFSSSRGARPGRVAPMSADKMIQEAREKREEQKRAAERRRPSASLFRPLMVG